MNREEKINRVKMLMADVLMCAEEPIDVLNFSADGEDNLLHEAAMRGNIEASELLIDLGIEIDGLGDMSNTALHYAAMFGYDDLYKFLVSKGASKNIVNEFGKTASQTKKK